MLPPPAWPNSGLNPFVSTWNSVIASSDGVRNAVSVVSPCRFVLTEIPSSVAPNAAALPSAERCRVAAAARFGHGAEQVERAAHRAADDERQFIDQTVRHGRRDLRVFRLNHRVVCDDEHGLADRAETQRHVDASGRSRIQDRCPRPSTSGIPVSSPLCDTCRAASSLALYVPESDDTTLVALFVPALITAIDTPGTAAFDESMTTPVMVPRSVCANAANGRARTTAAMNDAVKRVKAHEFLHQKLGNSAQCWHRGRPRQRKSV